MLSNGNIGQDHKKYFLLFNAMTTYLVKYKTHGTLVIHHVKTFVSAIVETFL